MRGIRLRLVSLFLLAIIPGLMAAGLVDYFDYRDKSDAAAASLVERARQIAAREGTLLGNSQTVLHDLAERPAIRATAARPGACWDGMAATLREHPEFVYLRIVDLAGEVTCAGVPADTGIEVADRSWFKRLVARRDFVVGDIARNRNPSIQLAYPVFAADGTLLGAVAAALDIERLNERLWHLALEKGTVLTLFDSTGTVLARYPEPEKFVGRTVDPAVLRRIADGKATGEADFLDGKMRMFASAPLGGASGEGLIVSLGMDRALLLAGARWNLFTDLAILCSVVFFGMAGALVYGRRFFLRPVERLGRAAELVSAGDLSARIGEPYQQDELGQVARAFDGMTAALAERDRALREANAYKSRVLAIAGHDLRQPLQIIRMSHEVLARRPMEERERRYLKRAEEAVDRLVSQLDEIAEAGRVERARTPQIEAAPVAALLATVTAEHSLAAQRKGLALHVVPSSATVLTDRQMMATVLRNLVGNAIKYTPRGRVLVGCRRRGDRLAIEVRDTGIGIPAERLPRIFDDFYRVEPERGDGLGLGLSIVRQTVQALGHRIEVASTPGRGSCFRLLLPLASRRAAPVGREQPARFAPGAN